MPDELLVDLHGVSKDGQVLIIVRCPMPRTPDEEVYLQFRVITAAQMRSWQVVAKSKEAVEDGPASKRG